MKERVRYSESALFILSDGMAMQEAISNSERNGNR